MENSQKKTLMFVIIIVCIVAAVGITVMAFERQRERSKGSANLDEMQKMRR